MAADPFPDVQDSRIGPATYAVKRMQKRTVWAKGYRKNAICA
jgi:hypothetical protein